MCHIIRYRLLTDIAADVEALAPHVPSDIKQNMKNLSKW